MVAICISILTFLLGLQGSVPRPTSEVSVGNNVAFLPIGVISGHVTLRETGELLKGVEVALLQKSFNEEGVEEIYPVSSESTNEKGEYRFFLPNPGRFHIGTGAVAVSTTGFIIPELSSDIDLEPPAKVNIDLAVERGRRVTVRGHFIDGTGHRYQHLDWVWLTDSQFGTVPPGEALVKSHYHNASTFEIADVLPGFYYVGGFRFDDLMHRADSVLPIVVRDRDLDVDLVSEESFELGGRIRLSVTQPISRKIRVSVRPVDDPLYGATAIHATPSPDGFFTLHDLTAGTYRLSILGVPSPSYVKSVQMAGTDVFAKGIKVPGADKASLLLDVLIANDGAQISGSVIGESEKAAAGSTVVLIPDAHGLLRPDLYKKVTADRSGQFSMAGIAPGDYRIYAWKGLSGYEYFDPAFMKRFAGTGLPVRITAGSITRLQLQERNARPL